MDFAADDVGIAAEMVSPELVGKDDDVIFAGDGFIGGEVAAEEGLFFDHFVEIAGRHEGALDAFGAFAGGDIEISVAGGAHGLEDGIFALPFQEVAGGGDVAFTGDFGPDDHELAGMRVGERGEQRGVDDAEDGGVGADAQGQSEDGDCGEAGIFAEKAETKTKVAQQVGHAWGSVSRRWMMRFYIYGYDGGDGFVHRSTASWHVVRQTEGERFA